MRAGEGRPWGSGQALAHSPAWLKRRGHLPKAHRGPWGVRRERRLTHTRSHWRIKPARGPLSAAWGPFSRRGLFDPQMRGPRGSLSAPLAQRARPPSASTPPRKGAAAISGPGNPRGTLGGTLGAPSQPGPWPWPEPLTARTLGGILRSTPYGALGKEMAARAGRAKMSTLAAASAVGRNPISIIVPCRQVVGARGDLTGYGGGLSNKIRLLELGGADMSTEGTPQSRRATAAPAALRP